LFFVFGEEDVGTFDISVKDMHLVERRETLESLVCDLPNSVFIDALL
jgi:hypothetical protein